MGKHVLYKTLQIILALGLISKCLTVPVRPRRQVQDLPLLHEDYDGVDYSSDNSGGHIVDDGTSHLSPLTETGNDHHHGNVEYIDNLHGNRSGTNDRTGTSDDIGGDDNTPNIDLEYGESNPNIDPDIDDVGNLNDNIPDRDSDSDNSNLRVQGRLPISGNDVRNSSSARQGHLSAIDASRTDTDGRYVINAVARAVRVNVSSSEELQPGQEPALGNQDNKNTTERPQVHHGFLMGGDVMVNTSEENKHHHGFLMGGEVQNIDNNQNSSSTTTRFTTSTQSVIPSSRTTTTESFITVRLSNISSHELTESALPANSPNNDIVIDKTDQTSGRRESPNQGSQDGQENRNDADIINSTTAAAFTREGHIATLPGESNGNEQGQENNENGEPLNENRQTGGNGQGVDVPIDKGEQRHRDNNEENNEPGPTRHTSNPEIIPATETTTSNLIRLPTPANLEPEEKQSTSYIQEPRSTVTVHGGEPEYIEPTHESHANQGEPGESGNGNNEPGNYSEETHTPPSGGNIEFVTEWPEIHGGTELKPNKNLPKFSAGKSEDISLLVSPTSIALSSERFVSDIVTEESVSESLDRNFVIQTKQPEILPSSTMHYSDVTSTQTMYSCSQSDNQICSTLSTLATEELLFPSRSALRIQSSAFREKSTQSFQETTSDFLLDTSLYPSQDMLSLTQRTYSDKHTIPPNSILPSKTTEQNMQLQRTVDSIAASGLYIASTKSVSKPSSNLFSVGSISDIKSNLASTLSSNPSQSSELFTSGESLLTTNVLHASHVYNSGNALPEYTTTEQALHASTESSTTNDFQTRHTLSESLYSSTEFSIPLSAAATDYLHKHSSQGQIQPSVTITRQTTPTPIIFTMLSSNATTKKKVDHNTTPALSTHSTQKKPNSDKDPDKPENDGSRSSSVGTTTTTTAAATTTITTASHIIATTLPTSTLRPATTQRIEISTPPSVYIEIRLRMDWNDFCSSKIEFISGIREIIFSEKGYSVDSEQFVLSTEDCAGANNFILEEEHIQVITIQMYIVDNDGKLDILLTTETSSFILKGFQQSNFLKDFRIISVHTVNRKPPELLPEARPERKQEPPNVTMVIVLASMGGVCCVALVILQVVLIHRRIKAKRKQRQLFGQRASLQSMDHVALGVIPKSRPSSGYWNPALDKSLELPEPDEQSHILSFSGLANFCMDSKAIYAEFQEIPFDEVDPTSIPLGEEDKNRFANVLPHKHNRVYLKKTQENKSGYINANYVDGYMGGKRVYIATQSPLVNTVDDFWRMIWEQQTRTILMLNPMTSQGKPKQSTCYWPDNLETDNQREFEDYIVTLKKRDVQKDYVDCTLEIIDIEKNLKREIHHFWFTCWPDTGPPEPLTFVKFVLDTRPHYENSGSPVVVHCGPGTGRTGTFIAVDTCMRMFEDRRRVDIQSCVHKMRGERAGAVQTKEQYLLIYQALNEYAVILSSPSISTRSSVITLHAML